MDQEKLRTILQIGETIAVEFKRCSNRIENDVYQSVCSFLNRFGGDIYLGVEDDGTVCGVPENAAGDMVKNFIKIISNPNMFTPTIYLWLCAVIFAVTKTRFPYSCAKRIPSAISSIEKFLAFARSPYISPPI